MFNSIQLNSHGLFSSELRQFFAQKTKLFKIFFCGGGGEGWEGDCPTYQPQLVRL